MTLLTRKQTFSLLQSIATFMCLAIVTVAWATTSNVSYSIFSFVRFFLILSFLPIILILIVFSFRKLGSIFLLLSGLFFLGVYSWLVFQVHATGVGNEVSEYTVWFVMSSAIALTLYLSPKDRAVIPDAIALMYVSFSLSVAALAIFMGWLNIQGVPHFVFDFTTPSGKEISYSQGVSKFYGLAAVFSSLLSTKTAGVSRKAICLVLMALFLVLSLIGGGRGDFLVTLILCIAAQGFVRLGISLILVLIFYFIFQDEVYDVVVNYSTLFNRYKALLYSLGMRDVLLLESFSLLVEKPVCLLFGCGSGYFQYYHGHGLGLYPHNVVVESVIIFGLVLLFPVLALLLRGVCLILYTEGGRSHFLYLFAFFLAVSMKSGAFITSYPLVGCVAYLCLRGLRDIVNKVYYRRSRIELSPH